MSKREANRLVRGIRDLCSQHVLEEKWLLAPSRRVGMQWLDAVTLSGLPVLNVRVKTFTSTALELAAPEMERLGLSFAGGMRIEIMVDELLQRLLGKGSYLERVEASPGLARVAAASLRDLRLAGVAAKTLSPDLFEVPAKGREIADLLSAYEDELSARRLADLAAVLRLAANRLRDDPGALPPGCIAALPADMPDKMSALERSLWEAVPEARRLLLESDRPCERRAGDGSAASLLAWASRPSEAPSAPGDGSVEIFRSVGEVNEVREVLRRCAADHVPFDEVEILHSDYNTYVPLIYEVCNALFPDVQALPVTFAEGIPVRYARPGRALAAWTSWIAEGFPQAILVRMIQDGLLEAENGVAKAPVFSRLGASLRALPVGEGRERYLTAIDSELSSLEWRLSARAQVEDGDGREESAAVLKDRARALRTLRALVEGILADTPQHTDAGDELLAAAEVFLVRHARCVDELDSYARLRLLEQIRELSSCLRECGASTTDALGWLSELARSARVEGKGPRPGCLYVAPLMGGGHSGRPNTFILGLDDGRFPGPSLQDPLLLDSERSAISGDLPTAAERLAAVMDDFARLTARLRGKVTLSYCCRSLEDDRDMFPSLAVLAAFRIISANREAVQDDLLRELDEPVSFAPEVSELCTGASEWWLHRLCGADGVDDPIGAVTAAFPHLGRGLEARRARESDLFTSYDGYVPEAGRDLDPARPDGPVLSASRLEMLGKCPLEYFFAYGLGISPPEEYPLDPSRWLDPLEKGSLLHALFKKFHLRLRGAGRGPSLEQDRDALLGMLEEEIAAWERIKPPPNRETARIEQEDLRLCALIFLREEEKYCRGWRPLYFEVAVGMEKEDNGNPVDSPQPVIMELPGEKAVRTRGRIDRIEEMAGSGSEVFRVCDYKTGSAYGYDPADPFRGGRLIQSFFYLVQAEKILQPLHPGARVESFHYFFPSTREYGERIEWEAKALSEGPRVLAMLCEMIARGCFPFTDNKDDVKFSDYLPAFGDPEQEAEWTRKKLAQPENEALRPFRELRGYAGGTHD